MAAALPLAKLAGLLVKTLAKPLAKRIKHEAARTVSGQNIIISLGQLTHGVTSRMTVWSMGYKVKSVAPLEETKALAKGAEFLGESFIFLVAGGIVVYEYDKSAQSTKVKEKKRHDEMMATDAALEAKLHSLDLRLKALEKVVKGNSSLLLLLGGEKYVDPNEQEVEDAQSKYDDISRRKWWPFGK